MIQLSKKDTIIEKKTDIKTQSSETPVLQNNLDSSDGSSRPEVVDAKVYKMRSAFGKNSVFITLGYISEPERIRPIEIFINSKDLQRAPEYVMLTRLISAIFRRSPDPMFIMEELRGIYDPNGGSFKNGKYYHSFYAEIADVIEQFFYDVGVMARPVETKAEKIKNDPVLSPETHFKICPECNERTLKTEAGCDVCMSSNCTYSKCDK